MLVKKLARLTGWNDRRREVASAYDDGFEGHHGLRTMARLDEAEPVYHLYVIQVDERDAVRARLDGDGIQTGVHYPTPLHLQPAYASLGRGRGDYPVAEAMAPRILSLPMHPYLSDAQVEYVIERVKDAVA
jgi:dTDP-4-amino-4,6-dideoxygalactose transaminase